MSLKDLSIYFKTDSKNDIAKIAKTAFTNQQIKIICLAKQGDGRFVSTPFSIDELKFNKNTMKEFVILADLNSIVAYKAKGIKSIEFSLDKSNVFNKNLNVIATYTVSDEDANTLISSTYKFIVQK
jgi:hypothetical protein